MQLGTLVASDTTTTAASKAAPHEQIHSLIEKMGTMSFEDIVNMLAEKVITIGLKVLLAIAIYIIGRWLINRLVKFMGRIFSLRSVDVSLSQFIISLVKITLTLILILTIVGVLGIDTTSFIAIFASAGLAVGMALSGTLQNFAGGVLILFLKPYRIGDFIEAQGYMGTVKEISLFSTLVNTVDNKMVIIPNGGLSTGIINNFSKETTRRVEWIFGVAYGTEYDRAKEILLDIINSDERVMKNREVFVALHGLADSSVNIVVRVWTASEHFWPLFFDINERVYKRFTEEGINIPFPQMDVHLHSNNMVK